MPETQQQQCGKQGLTPKLSQLRSNFGLNALLGRRSPYLPAITQHLSGTLQQVLAESLGLVRPEPNAPSARPRTLTAPFPKPTRQVESCGQSRVSGAEVLQGRLPIPPTARARCPPQQRKRDEPGCGKALLQRCGKQGLTPKLSRDA